MKKINVTFSLPVEVNDLLDSLLGSKNKSAFVAQVLTAALQEKVQALKKDYKNAAKDNDRNRTIEAWQKIDGGSDE